MVADVADYGQPLMFFEAGDPNASIDLPDYVEAAIAQAGSTLPLELTRALATPLLSDFVTDYNNSDVIEVKESVDNVEHSIFQKLYTYLDSGEGNYTYIWIRVWLSIIPVDGAYYCLKLYVDDIEQDFSCKNEGGAQTLDVECDVDEGEHKVELYVYMYNMGDVEHTLTITKRWVTRQACYHKLVIKGS